MPLQELHCSLAAAVQAVLAAALAVHMHHSRAADNQKDMAQHNDVLENRT
jgi:hypothetical protein